MLLQLYGAGTHPPLNRHSARAIVDRVQGHVLGQHVVEGTHWAIVLLLREIPFVLAAWIRGGRFSKWCQLSSGPDSDKVKPWSMSCIQTGTAKEGYRDLLMCEALMNGGATLEFCWATPNVVVATVKPLANGLCRPIFIWYGRAREHPSLPRPSVCSHGPHCPSQRCSCEFGCVIADPAGRKTIGLHADGHLTHVRLVMA